MIEIIDVAVAVAPFAFGIRRWLIKVHGWLFTYYPSRAR